MNASARPEILFDDLSSLSNPNYKIEIADEQSQAIDEKSLISVVDRILTDHEIAQAELSIAIVDDPAIRQFNKQYLNHDYETDVISFVLDYDPTIQFLVGQLIVSTDTAARLAAEVGGTMQDELLLYVIHGTLHLVGFDDKSATDAEAMRAEEKKYLATKGVEHRGWNGEMGNGSYEGPS